MKYGSSVSSCIAKFVGFVGLGSFSRTAGNSPEDEHFDQERRAIRQFVRLPSIESASPRQRIAVPHPVPLLRGGSVNIEGAQEHAPVRSGQKLMSNWPRDALELQLQFGALCAGQAPRGIPAVKSARHRNAPEYNGRSSLRGTCEIAALDGQTDDPGRDLPLSSEVPCALTRANAAS